MNLPKTPTACDARHKGVMLATAKWLVVPVVVAVIGVNASFYRAYAAPVEDCKVRLRNVESDNAVLISEVRAIRAALARMEDRQLGKTGGPK